jgi:holin-like protein
LNIQRNLTSFAILLGFYGAGEAAVWLLGIAFPGSVVGMILLATALNTGLLDLKHVEWAADLLLSQLGLLFVPPSVGVMLYFDLIARDWLALAVATLGSLVAVLWSTALTARFLMKREQ